MALRDVEDDRPRLEQGEIAVFIGRNLPERMEREMRGLLHLVERDQTDVVGLAHFLKRPANAHLTRQAPAAIGRGRKGGDGGGHWKAPGGCMTPSMDGWPPTIVFRIGSSPCLSLGRTARFRSDMVPHCAAAPEGGGCRHLRWAGGFAAWRSSSSE